jgi:ATP-dependent exoDNAse (exonuclease V) alpha subunit
LVHAPIELTNLNTFKPGMVLEVFGSNPRLNISKDGASLRVEGRADSKVILRNVVTKEKIQIKPSLLAKMDLRKFALTTEQPKKLAVGDAIIFKRTDKKLNLYNGQKAIVQRIKGNTIYYGKDMLSGQTKLDTNKYKYWDHNYAHTVYSAQGQTFKNCLALIDSEHKQLTTAKSFYVTISRAKEKLTLYTDNQDKLIDSISKQLGEKTSSIDNIKEIRQNTQASEREKTTTALPPEKQITSDTILQR